MTESVNFGDRLADAAALLRRLPRARERVAEARETVAAWCAAHPQVPLQLLIDQPPGKATVDYDLLVADPAGGRVALTCVADDGLPWAIEHGDHWASNLVVTLDGVHSMSVQQALLQLRMAMHRQPDLMEQMANHLILARHAEALPSLPDAHELQQAADSFRRSRGLLSAADTQRWLEEFHLPPAYFESMLELAVNIGKVKQQVVADRVVAHFESHRESFDRVRLVLATLAHVDAAAGLAEHARDSGLLAALAAPHLEPDPGDCAGTIATRYAGELPEALRAAPVGALIGPYAEAGGWSLAQVLRREPATLDDATRTAVEEALCRDWLAAQRAAGGIRWHWF